MEYLEDRLLQNLKNGTSVFKYVPDNIGEIVYCDSTNPKAAPDTKSETQKKMFMSICIPLALIALDWIFFYTSPIVSSIVTIVLLFIMYKCVKNTMRFVGTDYFVGTEGFATCDFSGTRDNVTPQSYRFEDFSDLITSETRTYQNHVYTGTKYFFRFMSNEEDGKKNSFGIDSTYNQEKPGDRYIDEIYRFWKKIEESWSKYKFNELLHNSNEMSIGFTYYTDNHFYPDYIKMSKDGIVIGETLFDRFKRIGFKNGNLIIEHENYSSKLFGLITKGDKAEIPLSAIGNKQLFLMLFNYLTNT